MGIYRCEVRIISRGRGHSAIGASAYRNGLKMTDERTGQTFDFGRKERIDLSEVILPANAPAEARDPRVLWDWLEQREIRSDAQLAREMTVSIPHELDWSTGLGAVRAMARNQFVDRGYPVEISLHNFGEKPDGSRNWHAHLFYGRSKGRLTLVSVSVRDGSRTIVAHPTQSKIF